MAYRLSILDEFLNQEARQSGFCRVDDALVINLACLNHFSANTLTLPNMPWRKSFSMLIRKLRLQQGWSQEQLAELTGLSVRTIQRVKRGESTQP